MQALVIDDDQTILDITCHHLTSQLSDLRIRTSNSGFEAIRTIETGQVFDIIISDYEMPNGTGTDVLKYLMAHNKAVPFILYTANLRPNLPKEPDKYFLGVIHKLDHEALIDTVLELLRK